MSRKIIIGTLKQFAMEPNGWVAGYIESVDKSVFSFDCVFKPKTGDVCDSLGYTLIDHDHRVREQMCGVANGFFRYSPRVSIRDGNTVIVPSIPIFQHYKQGTEKSSEPVIDKAIRFDFCQEGNTVKAAVTECEAP